MATPFTCTVSWSREGAAFTDNRYSRAHRWQFDGGAVVPGAASPRNVPLQFTDPAAVDPEEAFVAAVSSCHMLWFLSLAAQRGFRVDSYTDAAEGRMAPIAPGGPQAFTEVVLAPQLVFSGERRPDDATVAELHHAAHAQCYIAHSIKAQVRIAGGWQHAH